MIAVTVKMDTRDLLTAALDSLTIQVATVDPEDGRILFLNEAAARSLSGSREELIGTSIYEHFPDRVSAGRERLRQTLARRTVQHFESLHVLPDGRERHFESSYTPTMNEDGEIVAVQIISHDVTELRRAEHANRRDSEIWGVVSDDLSLTGQRLRAILENAPIIISVSDLDLTIRYINRVPEGIEVGHVIGQTPLPLLTAESQQTLVEAFERVRVLKAVTECRLQGTSDRSWVARFAPLIHDGEVTQVLGCSLDVTEQMQLQAQLASKRRLESLGTMARGIAHDFNNLLTVILGSSGLARFRGRATDGVSSLLDEIDAAAREAADLCEQMLVYAGRDQASTKPGNLNQVIDEFSSLTRAAVTANIRVTYRLQPDLPATTCNRAQLGQVVLNLINNAADAIGEATGEIVVSTDVFEVGERLTEFVPDPPAPGRYARLCVNDSGRGLEPEDRHRIFDPFYSTKERGHGLGLSVVLGILSTHGAAISVDSAPGAGTTMTVLLPLHETADLPGDPVSGTSFWRGGKGTVLLVDDEDLVRSAISAVLREGGYDVVEASSGDEALALLAAGEPPVGLVLLDVTMPGRDGWSTLRELRETHPTLPVLLSSGLPQSPPPGDPFAGVLAKPYSPTTLLQLVAERLKPSERAR
ncbi:MAG: PAS domain-containing protein [Myxococcales bacterium]|nr:PAS domain-containing protein [Myxococcales bacterium]